MSQFDINKLKKLSDSVEKKLREIPQLKKLHQTVGVPLVYLLLGIILISVFVIYVFSGLRAITNLVAFVYPAYMTIKAIDSTNKDDDTLWLTYWLFYGLFTVVESVTDVLLFWIPMYELLKMIFYIYLYAPQLQGAILLYRKLIQPFVKVLDKYEKKLSESFQEVQSVFQDATAASKTPTSAANNSKKN